MSAKIAEWREAQARACSPDDWQKIDRLAIEALREGIGSPSEAREALRLTIRRLRGSETEPIDRGDPAETWLYYALQAVWEALPDDHCAQEALFSLPFPAHSIARDNRLIAVSRPWCQLLGYSTGDVIGKRSVDFLTADSRRDALERYLPEFWETGQISRAPYNMIHANGSIVPVLLSAIAEFGADGKPVRSLAVISPA